MKQQEWEMGYWDDQSLNYDILEVIAELEVYITPISLWFGILIILTITLT